MASFEESLAAARLWAATAQPYLATALFALSPVPVPGYGTMGVDRYWRLYVDPACFDRWSVEQAGTVLVHEAQHVLRDHASRARDAGVGQREGTRFNVAADCEINDDLVALALPGDACVPSLFGLPDGDLAEAYYTALATDAAPPGDCGSGAHGVERPHELPPGDAPGVDEAEAVLIRQSVATEIARLSRAGGDLPSGLRRWAEAFLRPRVDWRRVLAGAVRAGLANVAGRVDYSYARPSRRTGAPGGSYVMLPSLVQPVPRVAVVVDTSASMADRALGQALGEVHGLLRGLGVAGQYVTVLSCDTAVHATQRVFAVDQVRLYGGGGTDLGAGLQAAADLHPRPQLVVVLTDGLTPWPEHKPDVERVVVGVLGTVTGTTPSWAEAVEIA